MKNMRILDTLFHSLFVKLTIEFDLLGVFLETMANPANILVLNDKVNDVKDEFPVDYANLLVLEIVTSTTEMHIISKEYRKFANKRTTTALAVKNMTKKIAFLTKKMQNTNKKIQNFMKKRNITREDGL
jgi:hypothetical protein